MFTKVLIANRGEIACRVAATCARLGIATVAVYSSADKQSRHVRECDEAVCIGPAPATASYLLGERILEAAHATGADAIHPGYGFLAENTDFVLACESAGIGFVGPPAEAVRAMGEKHEAKRIMASAGVPTIPGFSDDSQELEQLLLGANQLGYPLLIKAVAGGGGKGMRLVNNAAEFESSLTAARREAKAAFGDERVLLERYFTDARHIEVQVFADAHDNVVHLFERDCSVQRRHQKIIEEAPAPGLAQDLRDALYQAAITATRAIDYRGAGTVEFLLDQTQAFYFMEMNTRLQVEHGVTELITGVDLVEWQLRVASGEPLPLDQHAIACRGHAIEARLYAEDPGSGFLPSTGRLHHLSMPDGDAHLRIDSGVFAGDQVGSHYDPMIAKLMVWDLSRSAALARLSEQLPQVKIAGVLTNLEFLAGVSRCPAFQVGNYDTCLVDTYLAGTIDDAPPPDVLLGVAAIAQHHWREASARARAAHRGLSDSPWFSSGSWRLNAPSVTEIMLHHRDRHFTLGLTPQTDGWLVHIASRQLLVHADLLEGNDLTATVDGRYYRVTVTRDGSTIWLQHDCTVYRLRSGVESNARDSAESGGDALRAPMPGTILELRVKPGDPVRSGDPLVTLEAMKMEHNMCAPRDGVVGEVRFAPGDQVNEGDTLITLTSEQPSA